MTDAPVHTAIYTHGHVDHAFGLDPFLVDGQAPPEIIGHADMAARFERYARTRITTWPSTTGSSPAFPGRTR